MIAIKMAFSTPPALPIVESVAGAPRLNDVARAMEQRMRQVSSPINMVDRVFRLWRKNVSIAQPVALAAGAA